MAVEPGKLQFSFDAGDNPLPCIISDTDPGNIGAYRFWIDSSGGMGNWNMYVRNSANTGWVLLLSSSGVFGFGSLLYKRVIITLTKGDSSDFMIFVDFSDSLSDSEQLTEMVSLEHESHPAGGGDVGYEYDQGEYVQTYYIYGYGYSDYLYDYSYDYAPNQLWVFTNDDGSMPGPTTFAGNDSEGIEAGKGVWLHIRNAPIPTNEGDSVILIVKIRAR